jgi:exocyst complex component 3
MVDEPFQTEAIEKVKEGSDGFLKVAKHAYSMLMEFALIDSRRALVLIHCSQWYEQDLMRMVIGTYEDYCADYQQHLSDYLYSKLTTDLLDKFALAYLDSFRNKNAKFKMEVAGDKMRADLACAVDFFSGQKTPKRVKNVLGDVISKVISFIEVCILFLIVRRVSTLHSLISIRF